ncbi:uncharacterized protein KD926_011611 [Aspergillus affinis]|uniref:uncharacterized protein n=1 Tax=Aspergillus affinis TaxID=1070780 RepID=UPI0022FEE1B1|nr:uncharacterized protein KD926_011611 [Aspergillus affinis]KAI9037822.1 hypothetical protein KD926_011611 [Aspergillus affinis]
MPRFAPFNTDFLEYVRALNGSDNLPACYRGLEDLHVPNKDIEEFLVKEFSLGRLEVLPFLGYAGAKRPPKPLHEQIMIGREVIITERMDLHLLWTNDRKFFFKPLPGFLLEPVFWRKYFCCQPGCECDSSARRTSDSNSNLSRDKVSEESNINSSPSPKKDTLAPVECQRKKLWECAMGFLYSYICLISYESDFNIASEKYLLPRQLSRSQSGWENWKNITSEVLSNFDRNKVHRFLRAELRLARLDILHRMTQMPPFEPYLRHYWNYGSLFHDNITLLATATVFIALVLTAMQVGLATEQLGQNKSFMAASYGFTVFAILGPLCAFGLVILEALWHLVKELPQLLGFSGKHKGTATTSNGEIPV